MFSVIGESDRKLLNDVRRYGNFISRYDKVEGEHHTESESVFIYEYEGSTVVIFMQRGEYIAYFME